LRESPAAKVKEFKEEEEERKRKKVKDSKIRDEK